MNDRFERVAVVGTGTMGPGIALTFARGGSRVALFGRTQQSVDRGFDRLAQALDFSVRQDLLEAEQAAILRERVWGTTNLEEAVAGAGLVVESIPENLDLKRELFARLEEVCDVDTLLTSDTSGLRISEIVAGLEHPERTATAHFWNPPDLIPLVEITQGEQTSDATVDALVELLRACQKVPVVARKDVSGQIANRLQQSLFREATYMVQEGIASAEDVDLALKMGPGRRWPVYGVLQHHDVVGLELGLSVQRSVVPGLCRSAGPLPLLEEKVARGDLGVSTGRGFYDWTERDADRVKQIRDSFLCTLARDWTDV
ncbi:MAG: 3-hydroxyacyl-CoA dehydrogenase family protein [Chloroflexota bacterium]